MHNLQARLHPAYALVWTLLTAACVDQFEGSNIQVDFGGGTLAQVQQGVAPVTGLQLPPNTHYSLYGVRGSGPTAEYVEIQRFEVHLIVESSLPCFIEPEGTRFPGLHVTKFEERVKLDTGIADLANPPPGATEQDRIDVATANQRTRNVSALGRAPRVVNPSPLIVDPGGLKAITSASVARYPAVAATCVEDDSTVDPTLIPPATCTGDQSNSRRLELCRKVWAESPDLYSGTDRVLTEPLVGTYFGIVSGINPVNNAILGGTQFVVENIFADFDSYTFNWQFDDANGDGAPDYPMGFPQRPFGTPVAAGTPSMPTRGVTRVVMPGVGPAGERVTGFDCQLAIFSDLGDDDVHF
jgi:hypothetical protein